MNQGKIKMIVMKVVILNKAIESKANIIALDLYFGLVAQLGYQFLDPGSPRQFLIASGYRATSKWYSWFRTVGPFRGWGGGGFERTNIEFLKLEQGVVSTNHELRLYP